MSDGHLHRMDDQRLATALRTATPAWPATPRLADAVADRIRDAGSRHPLRAGLSVPSRLRTVLVAVAVVLALATAAVAAKLVIDIGAVTVRTTPGTPGPLRPESGPVFGDRVATVSRAEGAAGFAVTTPSALGRPDRVWVASAVPEGGTEVPTTRVTLAWDARPDLPVIDPLRWGAILMEFTGEAEIASKTVFAETGSIRPVRVEGAAAYWLVGEHSLTISSPDGSGTSTLRVAGHVLIWQRGNRTFRLETSLGLAEALAVAGSAR